MKLDLLVKELYSMLQITQICCKCAANAAAWLLLCLQPPSPLLWGQLGGSPKNSSYWKDIYQNFMICCNFHYCAANMQQYAAKQKFLTKLLLTIMFLIKNNTSLQNFMKFSLWVKELCSMLQIAKDAAIMLQMQQQHVFGACYLFYHSF